CLLCNVAPCLRLERVVDAWIAPSRRECAVLYHLLAPLGREHIVFNVFRYLTFRSAMAFISAFVLSLVLGPWLIARLREWQKDGSTLREDTPDRSEERRVGKGGGSGRARWSSGVI